MSAGGFAVLGSAKFARNIPLGCGVGVMGWRMEECDAPSVPDPLTAARRRRRSRRHFPPNVRCSPDCGLWRQDQAERAAMGAPDPETGPPRGSYAVPAPHLAPTSARLPLESAKNFAQHLSWKT